jgi:hypothetical protein
VSEQTNYGTSNPTRMMYFTLHGETLVDGSACYWAEATAPDGARFYATGETAEVVTERCAEYARFEGVGYVIIKNEISWPR